MKTIGAAKLSIIADAKGMAKGVREAKRHVESLKSTLNSAKKYVAGFVGAYVGLKGISVIADQFNELDQLAKTSRKLGMATEELGAIRYAAEQSGIGVNTLDMAVQRMTRRMSEAAHGTGEAKAAIAELGLDAVKLAQAGPAAALHEIADAMKMVKDPSDRLRLVFKLFDSEGVAMVNMFDRGSEGLREYYRDAEKLGILMGGKTLSNIEDAKDAWHDMELSLKAAAQTIAVDTAPAVKDLAKGIRDLVKAGHELGVFGALGKLNIGIQGIKAAFQEVAADLHEGIIAAGGGTENDKIAAQIARAKADAAWKKVDELGQASWDREHGIDRGANSVSDAKDAVGNGRIVPKEIKINLSQPKEAYDLLKKIREERDKLELGEFDANLKHLKDLGASDNFIGRIRVEQARNTGTKQGKKDLENTTRKAHEIAENERREAERLRDGMKTENEILLERIRSIEHLADVKALQPEEAKGMLGRIKDQMKPADVPHITQAMNKGSSEAYNTIVRALNGPDRNKQDEKIDRKRLLTLVDAIITKMDTPERFDALAGLTVEDF